MRPLQKGHWRHYPASASLSNARFPQRSRGRQLPKFFACPPPSNYLFARFQVCQICPDPAFVPNPLGTDKLAGSKQTLYWSGPSNS